MNHRRASGFSPALKFVLMIGVMSFFADFAYEGSRSIIGQYLGLLGAGALAISMITGFGEFLGYGLRLFSGRGADRTGLYWPITIGGYVELAEHSCERRLAAVYLASLGLPVPGRDARLFLPDHVFTHFEREEDIETLRGKFDDELFRIHEILQHATNDSVLIMNETFGSTTLGDACWLARR